MTATRDLNADLKSIASNSAPDRKVPELALHPLCTLIPPCTEEEFKELKEDIKKNGLQVPIKLFEGKILDGRSRHMACVELEKEWYPVDFKAEDFTRTTNDALAYVISMNVKRRHLTASQRAIIAARLVTTTLGGDRSVKLPTEITQENVARLSGVAVKMVTDAKKVLNHSDPELAKKVLDGEVAVAAAAKQVRVEERKAKSLSGHFRSDYKVF
jgi:ParB-like chromosome segregation protein Spo0J